MSVILIRPRNLVIPQGIISVQYPLNLGYLSSWLKNHGVPVSVLDYEVQEFSTSRLSDMIRTQTPTLVGISCMTSTITSGHAIATFIKSIVPDMPIVVGGVHATALPERTLREFPSFDIVVKGEGEETLLELYSVLKSEEAVTKVQGITYRGRDGSIVNNPFRPLMQDLNRIPFPDRDIVDVNLYRRSHVSRGFSRLNRVIAEVITARGCPFNCIFCAGKVTFGRTVRYRSVENITREIDECMAKYQTTHFSADSGEIGHPFRFISDTYSDHVGHSRSEATLAG